MQGDDLDDSMFYSEIASLRQVEQDMMKSDSPSPGPWPSLSRLDLDWPPGADANLRSGHQCVFSESTHQLPPRSY